MKKLVDHQNFYNWFREEHRCVYSFIAINQQAVEIFPFEPQI